MTELFYRSLDADSIKVNEEERTVTVPFSSEYPVKRYIGDEVLLHGEKNVDFEYLNRVGSVLSRHGGGLRDVIGPIYKVWIDNRTAMATIGFDDDELGNLALSKIKSKSLKGISFGYRIERGIRLEDETDVWVDPETKREYKGPAVIGVYWRAHEITLTPIPADHTVGFSRSLLDSIQFENFKEDVIMDKKEIQEIIQETLKDVPVGLSADEVRQIVSEVITDSNKPRMQVDAEILSDLSSRAQAVSLECKSKVIDMAIEGRTQVEILQFINDEAVRDSNDADHKKPVGNEPNNDDDQSVRSIDDISDDLFIGGFKTA